jgi:hypothetical protein
MATRRKINSNTQVKIINGQRWVCQRVFLNEENPSPQFDFVDNADGLPWKKLRLWKFAETRDTKLAGQHLDDKNYEMYYINQGYAEDGYIEGQDLIQS